MKKGNRMKRLGFQVALLCLAVSLSAAAGEVKKNSGYLGEEVYASFEKVSSASGTTVLRWHDPALNTKDYHQVILRPVRYFPDNPAPNDEVSAQLLEALPLETDAALGNEIGKRVPIVTKAEAGTLLFSAAITAVAAETERFKARELLPIALVFSAAKYAVGARPKEAVVQFEWELRDAQTRQLLAAGMRKGIGEVVKAKDGQLAISHLRPVIQAWAGDAGSAFQAFSK